MLLRKCLFCLNNFSSLQTRKGLPHSLRRPDHLHAADVVIAVVMEAVGQVAVAEGIAQVAHGFLDGVLRLEAQHPLNLVRIDVVGADAIP